MTEALKAVVVDDNKLIREIVSKTLEANGVDTVQAGDATLGWKAILESSPKLIIIDVMLPGEMDGVGLCRLIRSDERHKGTAVVMITASDKRREADRSLAAGADILIGKPFSPKQFWAQVYTLLRDKRAASV